MRYRRLSSSGDYSFGRGTSDFLVNSPEAVAQAVLTRLRLDYGAWFLNTQDGTPWATQVLGNNTTSVRDTIIKDRILNTPGVKDIAYYNSTFEAGTRRFIVQVQLDTIYGLIPSASPVSGQLSTPVPPNQPPTNPPVPPTSLQFVLDDPSAGLLDSNFLIS